MIVMGRTVAAEATNPAEAWEPSPHTVPIELTPDFHPEPFTPPVTISERMSGVPLADRIEDVMTSKRLLEMARGVL